MRFDQLIRAGMTVREVKGGYPETAELLRGYGFRGACEDCSLETLSRKYGLRSSEVVDQLNQVVLRKSGAGSHPGGPSE